MSCINKEVNEETDELNEQTDPDNEESTDIDEVNQHLDYDKKASTNTDELSELTDYENEESTNTAICSDDTTICSDSNLQPDDALADQVEENPETTPVPHFTDCAIPSNNKTCDYYRKGCLLGGLLDISAKANDKKCSVREINPDDWDEAVTGWKDVQPYAKYNVKKLKAKKTLEIDDAKFNGIRCVRDDIECTKRQRECLWKSNVEPVTYRYIPRNGQYRLHKFVQSDVDIDWSAVHKHNTERVKANRIQQEETRLLKNEFSRSKDARQSKSDEINNVQTKTMMLKSHSDLYAENVISSRLHELDMELNLLNQREDQSEDRQFTMSARKGHPTDISEEKRQTRSMSGSGRTFTITPVRKQDKLRPLEKVTPQQRVKEDLSWAAQQEKDVENAAIKLTNQDIERLQIMPLASKPSKYCSRVFKRKRNTRVANISSSAGGKTTNSRDKSAIGDEDCIHGDAGEHSGQSKTTQPNLQGISGQRIKVGVSSIRLL